MPNKFEFSETDHLAEIVREAIVRFAAEDGCTVEQWAGRAVRYVAVERLSGEAAWDGFDTLSAQRRIRRAGRLVEANPE